MKFSHQDIKSLSGSEGMKPVHFRGGNAVDAPQRTKNTVQQLTGKGQTIVLVSNLAWSIMNYRMPVADALMAAGYSVVAVAPVDESVSRLMKQPRMGFYPLSKFRRNSTSILAGVQMIWEFYRVYRSIRPDAVIHFGVQANIFGNIGARLAGVPSVCVVTGLGYTFLHQGIVPWLTRWLYRISFLSPKQVVFENQEDLELMVNKGLVARRNALRVPGCGIDSKAFRPQPGYFNNGKKVFLFIGRLLYDKGLREYAAAAEQLLKSYPQAECWILGNLDDENPAHIHREELVRWVQGGYMHYKGVTDDVRPVIAQCDWVVLPSYREGLSKVLLEAMSMGVPIITTDTPGCSETVEHGKNGFLVPVKDAQALLDTMQLCCGMPEEERRQMGTLGRKKVVEKYEGTIVGQAYLSLLQKLGIRNKVSS